MYTPLDASKRQTRLLHLLLGDDEAELRCRLSLTSLDDDPIYETVSYVWGTWDDPGTICIEEFEERVSITKNLESMLDNLHSLDQARVLWADAFCINQNDLDERSSQVSIMGDVYSRAWHVLAYLGEYFERCELAIEAIYQLGSDSSPLVFSDMEHRIAVEGVGLESPQLMDAVITFLSPSWMRRVWTV